MGATIVEISRLTLKKAHFYTLQLDGKQSEYEDFITRMRSSYPYKLPQLLHMIDQIGNNYGAHKRHFKHERNADALPPPYFKFLEDGKEPSSKYGLRLYCAVLSPEVVVLYNGDLKTQDLPNKCPNVARHFNFALRATAQIDAAIVDNFIAVDGMDLLVDDEYELDL